MEGGWDRDKRYEGKLNIFDNNNNIFGGVAGASSKKQYYKYKFNLLFQQTEYNRNNLH